MKEKFVAVAFNVSKNGAFVNTGKPYYFKAYEILNVDDVVVVDTQYGYQLATVIEAEPEVSSSGAKKITKSVVCRVDFTAFNDRMEKVEKARRIKELMDARIEKLKENTFYEMMTEKDPELKAMLNEYNALQEGVQQ